MRKIRIDIITPITGRTEEELKKRREFFDSLAAESTEVFVCSIRKGPRAIESSYDAIQAAPYIIEEVEKAAQAGSNAIIVHCFGDPGVIAARELVDIPIIGPGETSLHLACMFSNKFSIISSLESRLSSIGESVKNSKIDLNCLASVRSVRIPVLDISRNPTATIEETIKVGNKCIREDRAELIVLGCLGFAGLARPIEERLGIPVIDPAVLSLKMAELSASIPLSHSKIAFPIPSCKKAQI